MKRIIIAMFGGFTMLAVAGTGTMTSAPLWDLADHGGARTVSSAAPLEVPMSALPGFNFSAFTVEVRLTFGEVPDRAGFVIMDQELSETGWAVRGRKLSTSGNPIYLAANGEQYSCSYGMGGVAAGSTHTFLLAVRGGWMVVYMDGTIQKSYRMVPTPNEQPIRVGSPLPSGWTELPNVTLLSFKVWGEEEAYYAPGEPTEAANGFVGGKGWLVETPTTPLEGRPNVLYVGDSISDGYATPFKLCTKGLANVYHWTASFGTPGAAGVPSQKIAEVCALADFDKIVFNNGLHSLHWTESAVSDAEVEASYRELVTQFRAAAPHAEVFYLATTPYTLPRNNQGVVTGLADKNEVVLRLNRLARPVMETAGVPYIDAYALFVDRLDLARGDQYHWNAPAYELLASTVAREIGLSLSSGNFVAGADVVVPGWESVLVTDAELPTISALNSLTILAGGEVIFDLEEVGDLSCVVTNGGRVVKRGVGEMRIATCAKQSFGNGTLEIEEGVFWCPQDLANGANFYLGRTTVHTNGTLVTALSTANNGNTNINGLWGDGIVTNVSRGASAQLRVNNTGGPCVFAGRILGPGIRWYSNGNVWLTGTNSNFSGSLQVWGGYDRPNYSGTTAMMLIGRRGQPSSLGPGNQLEARENGGTFLYLGDGETTDRDFHFWNNAAEFSYYWDAGATGGVTFTGNWWHDSARAERVVLMGSNTVPCVLQGPWSGDTESRPTYLVKRGTGTWRFEDHAERKNTGGIAVEEGVLQFSSIANIGEVCSLGLATALQRSYVGAYDASKNVDYAYLLGSTGTRGTMEFVGAVPATSQDRVFAVKGEGEVRNSATAASAVLKLTGAKGVTSGTDMLVLGGDSSAKAFFNDVADGSGTLGVTKEGAGTWVLGGAQTFSGPLAVKAGVLEVQGLQTNTFTWFKFLIRGNTYLHTGANDLNVCFYGLEFYDADGVNQTRGDNMTFKASYASPSGTKASAGDWQNLQPGEYAWARPSGKYSYYTTRDIDGIFKIDKTGSRVCVAWESPNIALATPNSHAPILIRLPEGANRVVAFDLLASMGASHGRSISDWTLYGSTDGIDWQEVVRYDRDEATMPAGGNWFSDNSRHTQGAVRPGKGYACETVSGQLGTLRNVSAVTVAPGATLRARGAVTLPPLSLDCATGAGTFEGFDIPESGEVSLTHVTEVTSLLPGVFTDCPNLKNLSKWGVRVDGELQRSRRIAIRGNRLLLASNGSVLLVR